LKQNANIIIITISLIFILIIPDFIIGITYFKFIFLRNQQIYWSAFAAKNIIILTHFNPNYSI